MRNGFEGFKEIQERTLDVARYLALELDEMGIFEIYEKASRDSYRVLGSQGRRRRRSGSLYDLSDRLRMQRLVGACLPAARQHAGHDRASASWRAPTSPCSWPYALWRT